MLEIKFRGQRVDNKEFVFGYLFIGIPETYESYIIPEFLYNGYEVKSEKNFTLRFDSYHEVIHNSISKSTSLFDSTNKEVFAGDILEHIYDERLFKWLVVDMGYGFFVRNIGVDKHLGDCFQVTDKSYFLTRRIVGNICQTPEMLSL